MLKSFFLRFMVFTKAFLHSSFALQIYYSNSKKKLYLSLELIIIIIILTIPHFTHPNCRSISNLRAASTAHHHHQLQKLQNKFCRSICSSFLFLFPLPELLLSFSGDIFCLSPGQKGENLLCVFWKSSVVDFGQHHHHYRFNSGFDFIHLVVCVCVCVTLSIFYQCLVQKNMLAKKCH